MLKTSNSRKRLLVALKIIGVVLLALVAPILNWGIGGDFANETADAFGFTILAWLTTLVGVPLIVVHHWSDMKRGARRWVDAGDKRSAKDTEITELKQRIATLEAELASFSDPKPNEPGRYSQPPRR